MNAMIYCNSNCQKHRQKAARKIASSGVISLRTGGKCQVKHGEPINLPEVFSNETISSHRDNWKVYRNFKYCLVMENNRKDGYISEKLLWAYLGGCLPIFWGTPEVFDVFNRDSFLYYDPHTIIRELSYLQQNHSAYLERINAPILANGSDTIQKYFSLADDIGAGHLKRQNRSMMGLPNPPLTMTASEKENHTSSSPSSSCLPFGIHDGFPIL